MNPWPEYLFFVFIVQTYYVELPGLEPWVQFYYNVIQYMYTSILFITYFVTDTSYAVHIYNIISKVLSNFCII